MKKICIIYANCQNKLLAECLSKSALFNQEYTLERFPAHLLIQGKTTIPDRLLKQAKLFIYQPVKEAHGKASSKYLLDKLSPDCQTIAFPSLYFTGYFPQYCKNPNLKIIKSIYPFGIIPEGDVNVVKMLEQGQNKEKIASKLQSKDFYTPDLLKNNVNNSLEELARREANLEIKVSQFIRDNYQQHRLFYVHNHPTDILGIYVANKILDRLNLPQLEQQMSGNPASGILDNTQVPIYPSVIEHLQLDFARQITYKHNRFCTNHLSFERYIKEYINLSLLSPGSSGAYYFEGLKYMDKSQYAQAENSLKQAIKMNPQNAAYYRELGEIYQQQQQLDKAELVYKKAIELEPDWIDFYKSLGSVLTNKENYTGAALTYKQAIKLAPQDEELYSLLGDALINIKRWDLAEKCYLHAIKLNPKSAYYHRCLGDIYKQQQKYERAISYYEQALSIAPKNYWLYLHLSEALIEQNKINEANQYCKQSLKIAQAKRVGFYRQVGDLQVKIGSFDDAIATYQQAIKLNPNQNQKVIEQIRSQIDLAANAKECSQV